MRMSSLAVSRSAIHVRMSLGCVFGLISDLDFRSRTPRAIWLRAWEPCKPDQNVTRAHDVREWAAYPHGAIAALTEVNSRRRKIVGRCSQVTSPASNGVTLAFVGNS